MPQPELELASDLARIRAIYKLVPLPVPANVLEVITAGTAAVMSPKTTLDQTGLVLWRVEKFGYVDVECVEVNRYPANALLDLNENGVSADVIIMHGSYSKLKRSIEQSGAFQNGDTIFSAFSEILAHGGVLAGCFTNSWSIARVLRFFSGNAGDQTPCLSLANLRSQLTRHGFTPPDLFVVYPDMHSPQNLAEVNAEPSIKYSLDQTRYLRNWLGRMNFYLRIVLSLFGSGLNFEDEYFFFSRRK
jgi:hypothetical protein